MSRFIHNLQIQQIEVVFRILRYLKGTLGKGVMFRINNHLQIGAYTTVNWAQHRDERKSTQGT